MGPQMKLIAEYLADAIKFERLAAMEKNPDARAMLEKPAAAYRHLAENELSNKAALSRKIRNSHRRGLGGLATRLNIRSASSAVRPPQLRTPPR